MTLSQSSSIQSKALRKEIENVHYILIFNKPGTCIYGLNLSNKYHLEENLISGFCTAFMSFSKEMIGKNVRLIGMGNLNFLIFEYTLFNYGVLCKEKENLDMIKELVSKVNRLFQKYVTDNKINIRLENIYDKHLDNEIYNIVRSYYLHEYDVDTEKNLIAYLKSIKLPEELKGMILLSNKGHVVFSSLETENLMQYLKEIEFRVKICNNNILKLMYTSKDRDLIFSENIKDVYIIILVYESSLTRFGLAELVTHKISSKIRKILS